MNWWYESNSLKSPFVLNYVVKNQSQDDVLHSISDIIKPKALIAKWELCALSYLI